MQAWLVAGVTFLFGLAVLLYGYRLFLVMLPIWGFFAGFWLGGDLTALLFGQGFLATTTGWVVGFFLGVVAAILSYLYFHLAVAAIIAVMGYALGSGVMEALGFGGFLSAMVGLAVGAMVLIPAMLTNVKANLVMLMTAALGSNMVVLALLLVIGAAAPAAVQSAGDTIRPVLQSSPFWMLVWMVVAVSGYFYQMRVHRDYQFQRGDYVEGWG